MGEIIDIGRRGRWEELERIVSMMGRSSTALASTAWLLEAWPVEGEQDEVRDRIWREWRALGEESYECLRWIWEASEHAEQEMIGRGVIVSPRWRGYVAAGLVWLWRVGERRGVGFERGSLEVLDGVEVPERFVSAAPRRRGANGIMAAHVVVMGGVVTLSARADHEAGYWVMRASVMPERGGAMSFDGEGVREGALGVTIGR